ncbi:hypothetical protein [Campylobacter ureolyticus]|nr:hypothetical protein [Campylobacter ureolyticus]
MFETGKQYAYCLFKDSVFGENLYNYVQGDNNENNGDKSDTKNYR